MRVLDSRPLERSLNEEMVKKRQKNRQTDPGNSSDEDNVEAADNTAPTTCKHVNRSVNLSTLKKGLKQSTEFGKCTNCNAGAVSKRPVPLPSGEATPVITTDGVVAEAAILPPVVPDEECDLPDVYMCLLCGHQGCDRSSEKRHALVHYETPRSQYHEICLNTKTWQVWCYPCDTFLEKSEYKRLLEAVALVRTHSNSLSHRIGTSSNKVGVNDAARNKTLATEAVQNKQLIESNVEAGVSNSATKEKENLNKVKGFAQAACAVQANFHKVKGLTNLGNTCFFNAVMQNLSQTHILETELREYAVKGKSVEYVACPVDSNAGLAESNTKPSNDEICASRDLSRAAEINKEVGVVSVNLGEAGEMCRTLVRFFDEMNTNENLKQNCVNPSELLGQVCKKAPRFKGFQQQDSHELLHYLLDGVKAEEIKRSRSGILKTMNLPDNVKPVDVPEDDKLRLKAFGPSSKHTLIDRVFGGYFINTVTCEACNTHHQIFETFLDISLPIIDEKMSKQSPNNSNAKKSDEPSGADPDWIDGNTVVNKPSKNLTKKQQKAHRKSSKLLTKKKGKSSGAKSTNVEQNEEQVNENVIKGIDGSVVSDNVVNESNDPDEKIESELDEAAGGKKNGMSGYEELEKDDRSERRAANRESPVSVSKTSARDSESTCSDADVEDNEECDAHKFKSLNSSNVSAGLPCTEDICVQNSKTTDEKSASLNKGVHCTEEPEKDDCDKSYVVSDTVKKSTDVSGGNVSEATVELNTLHLGNDEGISKITLKLDEVCIDDANEIGNSESNVGKESMKNCSGVDGERIQVDSSNKSLDKKDSCSESNSLNMPTSRTSNSKGGECCKQEGQSLKKDASKSLTTPYEEECNRARKAATGTLIPRQRPTVEDRSVTSCLYQFTVQELLTGNNMFICSTCNSQDNKKDKSPPVKTCASKQMLIYSPPAILTLHLKRFQQVGFNLRKDSRHVQFSDMLDLAPYCSALCQNISVDQKQILYSLFGVVEHSGTMRGGHYTAYVKVRQQSADTHKYLQTLSMGQLTINRLVETMRRIHALDKDKAECEFNSSNLSISSGKWFYVSDNQVREVANSPSGLPCQAYLLFYERVY